MTNNWRDKEGRKYKNSSTLDNKKIIRREKNNM